MPRRLYSVSHALVGLRRGALAVALATASSLALSAPLLADTLRVVKHAPLRLLDPIQTTAEIVRNHGYMIYDTLFAMDESFSPHPQMVDTWTTSDDGLVWTFTLREGLMFHDGAPVTGADVAASLARWGSIDTFGRNMMGFVESMEQDPDDPRTMVMTLNEPFGLMLDALGKPSAHVPFIMPARIAATPATDAIEEHIGSGPFRWVANEFQPGVIAVYERNPDYIPRDEPASWLSGGKVVHFDRVEWVAMPDDQTALTALLAGEIDFWESPPADLLPILRADPDIDVRVLNQTGMASIVRPNVLHPPLDDVRIRQAVMAALYQGDIMQALIGDPELFQLCAAIFACGTALETDIGGETLVTGEGVERARELMAEAGYDGAPIVLLHATDNPTLRVQPVVMAQQLRDAGFNVDLQSMDHSSVLQRRTNQAPPAEGGWGLHVTNVSGLSLSSPLTNFLVGGRGTEGGWFGWAEDPMLEEMRAEFIRAPSAEERRAIGARIQERTYAQAFVAPLGQFFTASAWSSELEGVMNSPVVYFWNIRRAD